ncbi:hypothetical protein [Wenjunlia tyrosinilytica]|uniref:Uncharacterized protein n=1 Tax=Wenjunlia tyrosinilytica TaxID=1544741 RepID=A0A917ZZ31_9ACTN|nr:hypothetical protein [Wenjunlia tyrosinilytica]GGP01179.1 hypothetical protein GCM10012280_71510 [Wenjunlia tyrosinilytica]
MGRDIRILCAVHRPGERIRATTIAQLTHTAVPANHVLEVLEDLEIFLDDRADSLDRLALTLFVGVWHKLGTYSPSPGDHESVQVAAVCGDPVGGGRHEPIEAECRFDPGVWAAQPTPVELACHRASPRARSSEIDSSGAVWRG